MATVSVRDVRKRFGASEVLHGVSIEIGDSEFVILVGPSGCGKSTLRRMVAGLENVSSGEIAIGRRVVNNVAPKERDIAMVFQNYALYPHMTVRGNMAFALSLAKCRKIDRQVARAAQILGLTQYLNRYPRQLSPSDDGQPSTVSLIEPTGSETQVTARFAGAPIICAFRERIEARPGETIHIAVDPASVHLFDAGNHQRMEGG